MLQTRLMLKFEKLVSFSVHQDFAYAKLIGWVAHEASDAVEEKTTHRFKSFRGELRPIFVPRNRRARFRAGRLANDAALLARRERLLCSHYLAS